MQLPHEHGISTDMRSNENQARPIVLRELSLLRALGASLSIPRKLRRVPLSLPDQRLPQSDAFPLVPRHGESAVLVPEERS
jgi:hypothetical protein